MSKSVLNSLTPTYATFSGNVESIKTTSVTVADKSDLDALETRLNNSILLLQKKVDRLEEYIDALSLVVEDMPETIKKEVAELSQQQKIVLNTEYRKIVDDIAKKCVKVHAALKYE